MDADVIVIGAGPGGSTAAALLARSGWDVLLVDRAVFPRPKTCGDALSPRAVAMLRRLGCEEAADGAFRIHSGRMIAPGGATLDVPFAEVFPDLPSYGLVLPRVQFDDLLLRHAIQKGARFRQGAPVGDVVMDLGRVAAVKIPGDGGNAELTARLVIVATGASLSLLKRLGVLRRMPPVMRAARAYYRNIAPDGRLEFAFPKGLLPGYAWAFPVTATKANIGVALAPGTPGSATAALRRLEQRGDLPWLQQARRIGTIQGYPIRTDFPSHRVHGANWMVIGEAAGLVNPITGEGIDLAMESAALAAEMADAALREGEVSFASLKRYDRELRQRYAGYFRGARLLQRIILRPLLVNRMIVQARHHRDLAGVIATVSLGVASPALFATPKVWWRILR